MIKKFNDFINENKGTFIPRKSKNLKSDLHHFINSVLGLQIDEIYKDFDAGWTFTVSNSNVKEVEDKVNQAGYYLYDERTDTDYGEMTEAWQGPNSRVVKVGLNLKHNIKKQLDEQRMNESKFYDSNFDKWTTPEESGWYVQYSTESGDKGFMKLGSEPRDNEEAKSMLEAGDPDEIYYVDFFEYVDAGEDDKRVEDEYKDMYGSHTEEDIESVMQILNDELDLEDAPEEMQAMMRRAAEKIAERMNLLRP